MTFTILTIVESDGKRCYELTIKSAIDNKVISTERYKFKGQVLNKIKKAYFEQI